MDEEGGGDELLPFIAAFVKAIRLEMDAMRRQLGPFEIPLSSPTLVSSPRRGDSPGGARPEFYVYRFRFGSPDDKLIPGLECSLRSDSGDELATVGSIRGQELELELQRLLPELSGSLCLVIYPWFLYERLIRSLESLPHGASSYPESALGVFGKGPFFRAALSEASRFGSEPPPGGAGLNPSQSRALGLCLASRLAFVWGPPGTGKTLTLARIVEELSGRGLRVLVASTTNAAVDQALSEMAERDALRSAIEDGALLRMGRSEAPTFGASPEEALERRGASLEREYAAAGERALVLGKKASAAAALASRIDRALSAAQRELFGDPPSADVAPAEAAALMPPGAVPAFLGSPASARLEFLKAAEEEARALIAEIEARRSSIRQELEGLSRRLVPEARVVLATLSALAASRALAPERFDAVVVEEAGMAVLPAVFHCASLARSKVILVGDPRQLPPIVQSEDPYARKAMGRGIFDVAAPDPAGSPLVAMLDLQYRMHPDIGGLVSRLYYEGRLRNGAPDRSGIAAARPAPGSALALVDTGGLGECLVREGGFSRYNEASAELCAEIAALLAGDGLSSIAVIAPYAEHARIVRRRLAERGMGWVECSTVHRFQGHESDAVILDAVDSGRLRPGVLLAGGEGSSAPRLLNVSVSRARGKLVVLADLAYFARRAPGSPVSRLLEEIARSGRTIAAPEASGSPAS